MEIISPGLTQQRDEQTNTIIHLEIREAILRSFQYENRKHWDNWGIVKKQPKESEPTKGIKLTDFLRFHYYGYDFPILFWKNLFLSSLRV